MLSRSKYVPQKKQAVLLEQFGRQVNIDNLSKLPLALESAAILVGYLKYTQKNNISHFKTINRLASDSDMILDYATLINLELFSTLRTQEHKGTLIHHLDHTSTAMGGRMLRSWIRRPLINKEKIQERHEVVELFLQHNSVRGQIISDMKHISDIERILSRLSLGAGNARDLILMRESLKQIMKIREKLPARTSLLIQIKQQISPLLDEVIRMLENSIVDNPPYSIKEGGMIKEGVDKRLDELKKIVYENSTWLEELEKKERDVTGISTLKVRFNKVYGFYIEVSKANKDVVPEYYMRKQTLVNAERFITDELKKKKSLYCKEKKRFKNSNLKSITGF